MPSSPTSPTRSHELPASIRCTKAPTDADDDECPICHQSAEPQSATLTHEGCGRWFDEECLRSWLDSQDAPTCPWCRNDLLDLWDLDQHDRFHKTLDALDDLEAMHGPPTEYHVRRTCSEAVELIGSAVPDMPQKALEKLVSDAVELIVDAVDFGQYHSHGYPMESSRSLVEGRNQFKFDSASIRSLWVLSRVFGNDDCFLLRLPTAPKVGVFLPCTCMWHIRAVCCFSCIKQALVARHGLHEDDIHDVMSHHTAIRTIPLSTDYLYDRLMPVNEIRGSERATLQVRAVAASRPVSHWCLVDLRELGPYEGIYAIPWPSEKVEEGFRTLRYPWERSEAPRPAYGWDVETEAPMLTRFVAQHALMPDHESYLYSRPEGENINLEADECSQKLQYFYNIQYDEDLRMHEEKMSAYYDDESSTGSEDDEEEEFGDESSEDSEEDEMPLFEHGDPESRRITDFWRPG